VRIVVTKTLGPNIVKGSILTLPAGTISKLSKDEGNSKWYQLAHRADRKERLAGAAERQEARTGKAVLDGVDA